MAASHLLLLAAALLLLLLLLPPRPGRRAARAHPRLLRRRPTARPATARATTTAAIQAAINACGAAGAARVLLPAPGDYLTATVHLRSRVVLEVAPGARLLGGTRQRDYPPESSRWYVVLAENTTGAGVTGGGEINGQGVLHLVRCDNSVIRNVSIYGDFDTPNNDGIDIEGSNNTIIADCHIDTGDDAICPKSGTGPGLQFDSDKTAGSGLNLLPSNLEVQAFSTMRGWSLTT
ncbi:hypothetical protein ACQ4PT_055810 [Festuca glaucescens]